MGQALQAEDRSFEPSARASERELLLTVGVNPRAYKAFVPLLNLLITSTEGTRLVTYEDYSMK